MTEPACALPTMESRRPHSIHVTDAEWDFVTAVGRVRQWSPSVAGRICMMYGARMLHAQGQMEGSATMLTAMLGGSLPIPGDSLGTARFAPVPAERKPLRKATR